ncbi:SRPBCC domain-containing protein [Mariniluteicoccus flavus]
MTTDRIERETLIAAPLDRVWAMVAQPGWWVADEGTLTQQLAEEGQSMVAKNSTYGEFPVRVEKVDPPSYLAYRWASAFPGAELRDDNSTLVEFLLSIEGDATRLRVVESGFGSLTGPEDHRDKAMDQNADGWGHVLADFRTRVEATLA